MSRQITIAIFLLTALILGIFLVWPKYQDLQNLNSQIRQKQSELKSQGEYFLKLEEISQRLEDQKEILAKIDSALPGRPSLPALFDFLQKTSSQSGLVLKEIGFGSQPILGQEMIKEIQIPLVLSGSYPAFKDFLKKIEKSARILEVNSVSFSSLSAKEKLFDFSLKIKTYSY